MKEQQVVKKKILIQIKMIRQRILQSDVNPLTGLVPGLGLYERDKNPDAKQDKPNLIVSIFGQLISMLFFVLMVSSILYGVNALRPKLWMIYFL